MFSGGQGPEGALREPLLEPEVGEVGSIFPFLLVKETRLVLVVLILMVALVERRGACIARTVLEATLSIGSVHGSYGVGGFDEQSKIVELFLLRIFVLF